MMKTYWRAALGVGVVTGILWAAGRAVAQSSQHEELQPVIAKKPQPAEKRTGRGERWPDKLKVGDMAPDFTLKSLDGPQTVTLSDFRGKRPVVLIFGSYT